MKILVEVELDKLLLRGTKIKLDDEMVWTDFRYKNLPSLCFYCGRIGHIEKNCVRKLEDASGNGVLEDQYGA